MDETEETEETDEGKDEEKAKAGIKSAPSKKQKKKMISIKLVFFILHPPSLFLEFLCLLLLIYLIFSVQLAVFLCLFPDLDL